MDFFLRSDICIQNFDGLFCRKMREESWWFEKVGDVSSLLSWRKEKNWV